MFRLIKYALYIIVFFGVVYLIQEVSAGKINPQEKLRQVSQQVTDKTSQLIHDTYENTILNFSQTADQAVRDGKNIMKRAVTE